MAGVIRGWNPLILAFLGSPVPCRRGGCHCFYRRIRSRNRKKYLFEKLRVREEDRADE